MITEVLLACGNALLILVTGQMVNVSGRLASLERKVAQIEFALRYKKYDTVNR